MKNEKELNGAFQKNNGFAEEIAQELRTTYKLEPSIIPTNNAERIPTVSLPMNRQLVIKKTKSNLDSPFIRDDGTKLERGQKVTVTQSTFITTAGAITTGETVTRKSDGAKVLFEYQKGL